MRKIGPLSALWRAAWCSVFLLWAVLLLICASSAFALVAEDGLVIGDDYEYEQRGDVWIPEKKLTAEQIAAAEAEAEASSIGANYVYSVPLYGQCWSPWRYYQLGTCNLTICDAGCAMCSTAMVFSYHGVSCDPASLNTWLRNNGGYSGGCNLIWSVAAGYSSKVKFVASYNWNTVAANLTIVNQHLDEGKPLVCEVRNSRGGMHFVTITGRNGSTYYINDPGYGDSTTLNARYGSPAAACYGIRIYDKTAPPPPTWNATYVNQSYPSTITAGETAVVWAEFKNTGTGTWTHSATCIGTSSPANRVSPFYNSANWINNTRPSDVDQTSVATNQTGRFSFIIKAPTTPGTYTEKYKLVQSNSTWFGPEITWTITVKAATGNITGTVRNSYNNDPVSGATVAVTGGPTATTNASGVYTISGLAPGAKTLTASRAGFETQTASVTVTAGATATQNFSLASTDKTAPTAPTNLTANAISPSQINLAWSASTDSGGAGLAGYIVYRGGSEIGRTASTSYSDNGLTSNSSYSYTVKAYDNAGNVSGASNTATATTQIADVPIFQDGFANLNYWQALVEGSMPGPNPAVLVDDSHNHAQFPGVKAIKTVDNANGLQGCLTGHTFDVPFGTAKFESWFFDGSGLGYIGQFEEGTEGWAGMPNAWAVFDTISGGTSGKCLRIKDGGWQGGAYKEFTGGFAVGEAYTLKLSMRLANEGTWGTAPYVFVKFLNSSGAIIGSENTKAITLDNAWHTYTLTGTVPTGATKIQIGQNMYLNATKDYYYYMDDVSFITSTDVKVHSSRQGLQVRCVDSNGSPKAIYYLGTYNADPGSLASYSGGYYKVCGAGCTGWYWPLANCKERTAGWHKFTIDFTPYTGAGNEVKYYIDGTLVGSVERTLDTQEIGLNMVAYGFHYRVNNPGWFDDCAMYAAPPVAPTMGAAQTLSTTSIRWKVTDKSNNEVGFKVVNAAQAIVASAPVANGSGSVVNMDETGLVPNTAYTRTAKAFNGSLDSSPTAAATKWTLSVPPSKSNVTSNRAEGSTSASPDITFTAVGGFKSGTLAKYLYAWDTSPTHTWTGSEEVWDSGDLILEAPATGQYYLHVKGYNGENVENGTLNLGPYGYQATPEANKISDLWPLEDGEVRWLHGKIVTAKVAGGFYMEEPNRTAGVLVVSSASVQPGDVVNVEGTLGLTESGSQRLLTASYVEKSGVAAVPGALFMVTKSVGGNSPSDFTPGSTLTSGLYNAGLLARLSGQVVSRDISDPQNKVFYLDDGCKIGDGNGGYGILVRCGYVTPPASGMVAVTGIITLEAIGKNYAPALVIRGASDLSQP